MEFLYVCPPCVYVGGGYSTGFSSFLPLFKNMQEVHMLRYAKLSPRANSALLDRTGILPRPDPPTMHPVPPGNVFRSTVTPIRPEPSLKMNTDAFDVDLHQSLSMVMLFYVQALSRTLGRPTTINPQVPVWRCRVLIAPDESSYWSASSIPFTTYIYIYITNNTYPSYVCFRPSILFTPNHSTCHIKAPPNPRPPTSVLNR